MGQNLADQFRDELRDFYRDRLVLEQRLGKLEAFMLRYDAPKSDTNIKSEERTAATKGRWEFWRAVVVQILITGGLILVAWMTLPTRH